MKTSVMRIQGGTSRSVCDFSHEGRLLFVQSISIHDVLFIGRLGLSLEDVDHCGKFFRYVCKEMSDKAVIRDFFGRGTRSIAVVDPASEVGSHLLVFGWVAVIEFA